MKTTLLLSTLALSTITLPTNASSLGDSPKDMQTMENTAPVVEQVPSYYGVGTGAVVGTLVGGPIGLILGSAFGGMIVDDINKDKQMLALETLNAQHEQLIASQQTELQALAKQVHKPSSSFEQVSLSQPQVTSQQVIPELLTHIQFATGASNISSIYEPQLDLLIKLLASHENWLVTLTGYADKRGDDEFNYDLSRSRAEMVEHYITQGLLAKLGDKAIEPNIIVKGVGEANQTSSHSDGVEVVNVEELMFDRRVAIDIRPISDVQVAKN
ncbi:OmpA family protein [Alteromonas sp. LMIT006]|uniref:OmpA family protein n=1 Tax=Alteromonadaceae TaxID=72275 RepID=UPI0020CA9AA2|nr:OmpA family protein [Alteromonas sp. LMIT006]UTP72762.1 OmpA family protein [Alteromonas sp. LMIT006]